METDSIIKNLQNSTISTLNQKDISATQAAWREQLEQLEQLYPSNQLVEELELLDSDFNFINSNCSYGDYKARPNQETYLGVKLNTKDEIYSLVRLIYSPIGQSSVIKIMDMEHCPKFNIKKSIDTPAYTKINSIVLMMIVSFCFRAVLSQNKINSALSTKIYARSDIEMNAISYINNDEMLNRILNERNVLVELEGKRWLALRKSNVSQ